MTDQSSFSQPEQMKRLVDLPGGSIATHRITTEGLPVRFMYREEPMHVQDSGWRFFSGINEDDEYVNDPAHSSVYALNTIANYDQTIIPFLESPIGAVFEKPQGASDWQAVSDFMPPQE